MHHASFLRRRVGVCWSHATATATPLHSNKQSICQQHNNRYIRSLAGEIGVEHARRSAAEPPEDTAELMELVDVVVPFNLAHRCGCGGGWGRGPVRCYCVCAWGIDALVW